MELGYSWEYIFNNYVGRPSNPLTRKVSERAYGKEDIAKVIATADGKNDGDHWVGIFKTKDKKYLYVTGWCDYTGWDCQSGGSAEIYNTLKECIACVTPEHRSRLNLLEKTQGKKSYRETLKDIQRTVNDNDDAYKALELIGNIVKSKLGEPEKAE